MHILRYISLEDTNKEIFKEIENSNEMDKFLSKKHTWFNDEQGLVYYFEDDDNKKEIEALIKLIAKLEHGEYFEGINVIDSFMDDRAIECEADDIRIRLERCVLRDYYEKELDKCYKDNTDWTYVHYESWFDNKLEDAIFWTISNMRKNNEFSINL